METEQSQLELEITSSKGFREYEGTRTKRVWKKTGLESQYELLINPTKTENKPNKRIKTKTNFETYEKFLEEAEEVYDGEPIELKDTRIELLKTYFPRRFGDNGEQDISDYNAFQITRLFRCLVEYAKKPVK